MEQRWAILLPTVLDKLNVVSTIHLRKLIATLVLCSTVLCVSFYFVPLPLSVVIQHILEVTTAFYNIKMLASQLENADDKHPTEQVTKEDVSIEQEIECPRCHDVMTLHSEFDRLGYLCEECDFSLHLSH